MFKPSIANAGLACQISMSRPFVALGNEGSSQSRKGLRMMVFPGSPAVAPEMTTTSTECFLCIRHCPKHGRYMNSFNSPKWPSRVDTVDPPSRDSETGATCPGSSAGASPQAQAVWRDLCLQLPHGAAEPVTHLDPQLYLLPGGWCRAAHQWKVH